MKKLEGNGIWESSRMILPEHQEAIRRAQREKLRRETPLPDEQAWEEWARMLQESHDHGQLVRISVFDPFEDVRVTGPVLRIDPQLRRLRIGEDWIRFEDIVGVEMSCA